MFPASFNLVASMNPSPGGYFAGENTQANTPADIRRHGPGVILDQVTPGGDGLMVWAE